MAERAALITGGAGFIGSHLAERLLEDGWRVVAVDDLSTGRIDNVRALESRPGFRLLIGDAGDVALLRDAGRDVDAVFHLAAVVGVRNVLRNPVDTLVTNLKATEAAISFCTRHRKRLLIASSSEVYGGARRERFSEEDDCVIGPPRFRRWSYAAAKLMDEFHALAAYSMYALPVTIVRLFNTIGPRQVGDYGMVAPTFARQALTGAPLTVHGDGSQRRSFTAVRDVVRCLGALMEKPDTVGEVYNVGSDCEMSMLELAERIKRLADSDSPIVFESYRQAYGEDFHDMERRRPNVDKLRRAIGYAPDMPLDAMLRSIIDPMRAALANG